MQELRWLFLTFILKFIPVYMEDRPYFSFSNLGRAPWLSFASGKSWVWMRIEDGFSCLQEYKANRSTWLGSAHPVAVQRFSRCVLGIWISPFAQDLCVTLGPRGAAAAQQWGSLCRACSVQPVSGYSIWETWPRHLAWHTTVLDVPAGSATHLSAVLGLQLWYPGLQLCLSLTATLGDPQLDGFGRAPFLLSPRQQQLVSGVLSWYSNGGILSNKPFQMPYMPGKDWAALC